MARIPASAATRGGGGLRIVTIVGARPQFIKTSRTSRAFQNAGIEELIVHTGQHYDRSMSDLFFEELNVPEPSVNLGIGSGLQGEQTGRMLAEIERVLLDLRPDVVLVHGDTNSTLAGALAAAKLGIPVAHNESGLRSFNRSMPEEINRLVTDHLAGWCFCPNSGSVEQLLREGIETGVHFVGDVMYDLLLAMLPRALSASFPRSLSLESKSYFLATLHRPYTVDDPERLRAALNILNDLPLPVVIPLHPRTRERLPAATTEWRNLRIIEPVGYLDMLALEASALMILTDSGGVQKEAYFHGVPCLTLRPETEWVETVDAGWNRVVNLDGMMIREAAESQWWPDERPALYGEGNAAEKIAEILKREC